MIDLGVLQAKVALDTKEATTDAKNFGSKLKKFVGAAAVALGVKKVVSSFKSAINAVADYGDAVDKNSQKMGISSDAYQKWDYALERSGTSINALKTGMKNLNTAIEKDSAAFDKLGVSLKKSNGDMKSTEEIMNDSILALADMEDVQKRNALASELFGKKTAQELQPALNSGKKGLEDMKKMAEDYGMVLSKEGVKASADFEDALLTMNNTFTGLKNNLSAKVLPVITDTMNSVADIGKEISKSIKTGDWSGVTTVLQEKLGKALDVAKTVAKKGVELVEKLVTSAAKALPKLLQTLITGLINLMNKLSTSTGNSKKIIKIGKAIIKALFEGMKVIIKNLPAIIKSMLKLMFSVIKNNFKTIKSLGKDLIDKLKDGIKAKFNSIKSVAKQAITYFKNGIKENISRVISSGASFITNVKKGISDKVSELKDKGRSAITNFLAGVKDSAYLIKEWFSSRISEWFSWDGIKSLFGNKNNPKQLRIGLDTVPYDNYAASLHKGEMVLTAAEANQYRKRITKQDGVVNNNYIVNFNGSYSFNGKNEIDYFMSEAEKLTRRRLGVC